VSSSEDSLERGQMTAGGDNHAGISNIGKHSHRRQKASNVKKRL